MQEKRVEMTHNFTASTIPACSIHVYPAPVQNVHWQQKFRVVYKTPLPTYWSARKTINWRTHSFCAHVCVCVVCVCVCVFDVQGIQYYDYMIIIFQVLIFTLLLILQSVACSPLSERYSAIEMTANVLLLLYYYLFMGAYSFPLPFSVSL